MMRLRDPRIWIGLGIAAVFLWFAFRGVDLSEVIDQMARANWWILLGFSLPAYVLAIYVRALRWRYLISDLAPTRMGPLFRATAIGFMANNIFPLRIGEVVRAWHLAREVRGSTGAIFGTVVVERVLDSMIFLLMSLVVLGVYGGAVLSKGGSGIAISLAAVLSLPAAGVIALRVVPERVLELARWVTRPLPGRTGERLLGMLRNLTDGIGALRGGRNLARVALHSVFLWLVVTAIPFVAAIVALGIDLGSPWRVLAAAYVTLTLVGVAIAVPSSPGFFGPYHAACWWALALFGVPKEQAVALGTTVHGVFWVGVTLLGFAVLRVQHQSLGEIAEIGDEADELVREAEAPRDRAP